MRTSNAALVLSAAFLSAHTQAQSSVATYELTFDATWSAASHPGAYPAAAHFSPLVGATHNASAVFWAPGGLASLGIESMAETGSTTRLRVEINAEASLGNASPPILGAAINSPDSTTLTFEASSTMPLFTMVTMIAPSPDWFIGTHGLDLTTPSGWAEEIVVPLFAYDAGTDSGVDFNSADADTVPQEPIADFAAAAPFAGLPQLGTFTIRLLAVDVCPADTNADGLLSPADFSAWIAAFNTMSTACDQNGDNACTPADFSAWIASYNAGC